MPLPPQKAGDTAGDGPALFCQTEREPCPNINHSARGADCQLCHGAVAKYRMGGWYLRRRWAKTGKVQEWTVVDPRAKVANFPFCSKISVGLLAVSSLFTTT